MTFFKKGRIVAALIFSPVLAGFSSPIVVASPPVPVDLRTLVLSSGQPSIRLPIPRTKEFWGSRKIVFHFLGSQKFFIGIIVQSFEKNGRLLHHGLFDQGPIDEVLSRALFHKEERVQVLGIYRENGRYTLHLKRFATGKVQSFPLDSALRILMTHIGSKPDLCWAAR
ncbi:MAG: hypothetical protein C75L2_00020064 [Leptospirillum sp. Group II 'C75']|uniref:hypothetical protein n=1 Tax=Leptospirillum sp. Group II 'CF-1' TaxID=1660083 RepID=UPI00029CD065|nr:hypothetical protein [Leptospirillum sp. Group II 'CF-1']AKS22841.1 hypothetical protein ABH19_02385 [Leptospirillum sp. Group II 'CF-1']EIJ75166.1 MAG: hypothetical protein C75L2_00020064 [Leptospirillum sp. Group II 'C75']